MLGKNAVTLKAANTRMKLITVFDSAILMQLGEEYKFVLLNNTVIAIKCNKRRFLRVSCTLES